MLISSAFDCCKNKKKYQKCNRKTEKNINSPYFFAIETISSPKNYHIGRKSKVIWGNTSKSLCLGLQKHKSPDSVASFVEKELLAYKMLFLS